MHDLGFNVLMSHMQMFKSIKIKYNLKNHFPSYIHWISSVHEAHVASVYILDCAEL